jgi:predicted Zn finger-like uncharacterized protein
MFPFFVLALSFVFVGLLTHFVAEHRGRPLWEPWIVTGIACLLAMACVAVISSEAIITSRFPAPLFAAALAPLPPLMMFLFDKRGHAALAARAAPCPHCDGPFVVDRKFLGQSVRCPHCQQLFQLPAPRSS